jgi:hypothetical protein
MGVAIDGSKFQAVASKRAVVSAAKLEEQLCSIDRRCKATWRLSSRPIKPKAKSVRPIKKPCLKRWLG